MAVPSVVDVCNSALQKLGAVGILSLSDNTKNARECSKAFDSNRRAELRKYRWRFAIKRAVLSPLATAPAFDYLYAFPLPSDCLRVIMPYDDPTNDWTVENGSILTNQGNTLNLRYIADITDPTVWDSSFYDMLAIALAVDLCETITNSTSKRQLLEQEYKDALATAKSTNAFERMPSNVMTDTFEIVRL